MPKNTAVSSETTSEHSLISIQDSVHTFLDQGSQTVDVIRSRVVSVADEAKSKGSAAQARLTEWVTASPIKSVAIAFAIGYIAMRIRTSKLTSLGAIGGAVYLGSRLLRRT